MARRFEDVEKSMKRRNDKKLKVEHELSLKVCEIDILIERCIFNILISGDLVQRLEMFFQMLTLHIGSISFELTSFLNYV